MTSNSRGIARPSAARAVLVGAGMLPSRSPFAPSRLAFAALVALAAAACGANVTASSSTTATGATTTTGAGGSGSSCRAPRVDRAESGTCAAAGNYGVDESNPMCCRPCAADEIPTSEAGASPVCVHAGGGGAGGAAACNLGDPAWKACGTAADCEPVGLSCYCGPQPVVGITRSLSAKAAQCDSATPCALGCAVSPGHVTEDGHDDVDGGTLAVRCNDGLCTTVIE